MTGLGEVDTPKPDLLREGCNSHLSPETPLVFRDGVMQSTNFSSLMFYHHFSMVSLMSRTRRKIHEERDCALDFPFPKYGCIGDTQRTFSS